jgi:hypothetical protein
MKWLLGFVLLTILALAVLFVPVQGHTLWSRGAAREVAQFVAHGLRTGWDALASLGSDHPRPTRTTPPSHAQRTRRAQAAAPPRTSRDGIVAQPPKESLQADDRAALEKLLKTH